LHFATFSYINKNIQSKKQLKISTNNKLVPIGYQKIKYVRLIEKNKEKEKIVTKKQTKPKKKIKNKKFIQKIPQKQARKYIKVKESTPKTKTVDINQKIQDLQIIQKLDKTTQSYIKLYGDEYFTYSKEIKKYLIKNLNSIGRITQMYLRYPNISRRTKQQGMNIVEFYLYPNGDISNLKIKNNSGYTTLDKNTIKTIKLAYKDYPKPQSKTKIKIYVYYSLR